MTVKKVLIAIDGEPVAMRAAETGELIAAARLDAQRLVTAIHQRLSPRSSVVEFMPVGRPSEEIVKAAEAWSADLLVIGSHGRWGMQRALLGSMAEAVMRHAPCPRVVVRSQE